VLNVSTNLDVLHTLVHKKAVNLSHI